MMCKCGATLAHRESVRSSIKLRLVYQECKSCGRVHPEKLWQDGSVVAQGWEAFAAFDRMTHPDFSNRKTTTGAPP